MDQARVGHLVEDVRPKRWQEDIPTRLPPKKLCVGLSRSPGET